MSVIKKLSRRKEHRMSLRHNLAKSLFQSSIEQMKEPERKSSPGIQTTLTKAKVCRPLVEKLITKARNSSPENELHIRRQLLSILGSAELVRGVFELARSKCSARPGGYLRIIRTGFRHGDKAEMARISLVDLAR